MFSDPYTRYLHKSCSNLIHVPQILEIQIEALFEGKQAKTDKWLPSTDVKREWTGSGSGRAAAQVGLNFTSRCFLHHAMRTAAFPTLILPHRLQGCEWLPKCRCLGYFGCCWVSSWPRRAGPLVGPISDLPALCHCLGSLNGMWAAESCSVSFQE